MRCAVKVMSSPPKGKTLRKKNKHETIEDWLWCNTRGSFCRAEEDFTDTGPLCPVNLYRCLHVSASQIIISLFISPVAYRKNKLSGNEGAFFVFKIVAGPLTKYLASDEIAIHRM